MENSIQQNFSLLIDAVASLGVVQAIGKSGGERLPESQESDIDVFIFCHSIPGPEERQAALARLGSLVGEVNLSTVEGRHWGVCDFVDLDGAEVCLMYFTAEKMRAEIASILRGERLEKEENYFYPTGRCATFLGMHSLYDPQGFIAEMKAACAQMPDELARRLAAHHLGQLRDVEDLERAVSRQDVFFYHFALDLALDHFLQALFALNHCFFPSRKRTAQYLERFPCRPANCLARLTRVVELGARPATMSESYELWVCLCKELEVYHRGTETQRKPF